MLNQQFNISVLQHVAHGQVLRTVKCNSMKQYLSKVKVMTDILNHSPELRNQSLECNEDGTAKKHTGMASNIFKLKLPVTVDTAKLLFAALSIDDSLPRAAKKRRLQQSHSEEPVDSLEPREDEIVEAVSETLNDNELDMRNPGKDKVTVTGQSYQNYKSALKWWHCHEDFLLDKVGYLWPAAVDNSIKQAIASYKRDVGDKKRRGIMTSKEGKARYDVTGYFEICGYFNKLIANGNLGSEFEGLFGQLFTKLSVGTIGRSDNIDDLILSLMDWDNDALVIEFCTTKADQAGETTSEKKHLFANPFKPEICVVLGLAVYIFCKRRLPGQIMKLFDGDEQHKRYYDSLMLAVKNIPSHINLGCSREDIGTHSNRKFAESTSVSKVDGPNRTQVCLRSGQSVGRTQDCYMFQEDDGDCFVGRTVAQLKFDADEFDVLPCHFSHETLEQINTLGWGNILDGYSNYPASFKRVIPFLFASLVYHYWNGDIERCYGAQHSIWKQKIFLRLEILTSLKDKVILCHSYCSATRMSAQGVPAVIVISREIRNFRAHYDTTLAATCESLKEVMQLLDTQAEALPRKVVECITQNLVIAGAVPVTQSDIIRIVSGILGAPDGQLAAINTAINNLVQQQTSFIESMNSRNSDHGASVVGRTSTGAASYSSIESFIHTWPNGTLHLVPYDFEWPSHTVNTMWNLWFIGQPLKRVGPFRRIKPCDMKTHKMKVYRARTAKVIDFLVQIAIDNGKINNVSDVTETNRDSIFEFAYPQLIEKIYGNRIPGRITDINTNTLANKLMKSRGSRGRDDVEESRSSNSTGTQSTNDEESEI